MQKVYRAALKFCLLSLLSGCIVGRVLKTDGTPYEGAVVLLQQCEVCPARLLITDEDGYYAYDYYELQGSGSAPIFNQSTDGIVVTLLQNDWSTPSGSAKTCHRTPEVKVTRRTLWRTSINEEGLEEYYSLLPPIFVEELAFNIPAGASCFEEPWSDIMDDTQTVADVDNDGLSDAEEALAGTDPLKDDTDDDGLSDSLELYGSLSGGFPAARTWESATDIRSRGASPRRRDVFVEVDYHIVKNGTAIVQSQEPSQILIDSIQDYYTNPLRFFDIVTRTALSESM